MGQVRWPDDDDAAGISHAIQDVLDHGPAGQGDLGLDQATQPPSLTAGEDHSVEGWPADHHGPALWTGTRPLFRQGVAAQTAHALS